MQTSEHGLKAGAISFWEGLIGFVVLLIWRIYKSEPFFKRRPEVADPMLLQTQPTIAGGSS